MFKVENYLTQERERVEDKINIRYMKYISMISCYLNKNCNFFMYNSEAVIDKLMSLATSFLKKKIY